MGNNLQALRTAKALTKQLAANESYVTENSGSDLEIEHQNEHSNRSMSPESLDSVTTQDQSSTQESNKKHKIKELMSRGPSSVNLNGLTTANHGTNAFVYYVPQNDVPDTQPLDGRLEETINDLQHRKQTSITQARCETTHPKSKPVVVDLTLDDSDEEDTTSSPQTDDTNTFPKILAAYSLNAGNSPFPASDLCALLGQKAKEIQGQPNGTVVETSTFNITKPRGLVVDSSTLNKTKPTNGLVFHNRPKMYNVDISNQRIPVMNGVLNNSSDDSQELNKNLTSHARSIYGSSMVGYKVNGVMNDVTNSTNQVRSSMTNYKYDVTNPGDHARSSSDDVGMDNNENDVTNTRNASASEYRPLLFSSWSKTAEPRTSDPETSSTDSGDNVVITKVVTPADKVTDRSSRKHPRKEPIKVRQLYFEQTEVTNKETATLDVQDANKMRAASSTSSQPGTRKGRYRVDNVLKNVQSGAQWSVDESSQETSDRLSPNDMHREAKIRTLKNLLAKQEVAVQKMRTTDNGSPSLVPSDRVLVVEIPDLKSELHLPKEGKHSFRVCSQTITLSPNEGESSRKRPRKSDPRKITRQEERYPSYVDAKGLSRLHDDDDDVVANKKFKGKSRGKSRGRSSPKPSKPVPVVVKDHWHRELEKVEAVIRSYDTPVDKATFMLFLGLKQV